MFTLIRTWSRTSRGQGSKLPSYRHSKIDLEAERVMARSASYYHLLVTYLNWKLAVWIVPSFKVTTN